MALLLRLLLLLLFVVAGMVVAGMVSNRGVFVEDDVYYCNMVVEMRLLRQKELTIEPVSTTRLRRVLAATAAWSLVLVLYAGGTKVQLGGFGGGLVVSHFCHFLRSRFSAHFR